MTGLSGTSWKMLCYNMNFVMSPSLIMKRVRSISLNICLFSENVSSFLPSRGIGQGNPVSLYLFILVSEVLPLMISKSQQERHIKGVKFGHPHPYLYKKQNHKPGDQTTLKSIYIAMASNSKEWNMNTFMNH